MTKTLVKMIYDGVYKVIYDDSLKINKYKIVKHEYGHQKQIVRYADYESCLFHLWEITCGR